MSVRSRRKKFVASIRGNRKFRNRATIFILILIGLFSLVFFNFFNRTISEYSLYDHQSLNYLFVINLNIILLIVMILLISRYFIRLLYERKIKILGYRIKSKLIFAFIAISTFPLIMFYVFVDRYIQSNVDFLYEVRDASELQETLNVLKNFNSYFSKENEFYGSRIVKKISNEKTSQEDTKNILEQIGKDYPIDALILYNAEFKPIKNFYFSPDARTFLEKLEPPTQIFEEFRVKNISSGEFNQTLEKNYFYRTIFKIPGKQNYLEVFRKSEILSISYLQSVQKAIFSFKNFFFFKELVHKNYTYYLLFLVLILVFICIWFSYYLAKNITRPIEHLLIGTEELMAGNLDYRVPDMPADDMKLLISGFNKMMEELKEKSTQIERNRVATLESNRNLEKSNLLIQSVIQNIRSGVLFFDNAGLILGLNRACRRYLSIKEERCENLNYRTVVNRETLPLILGLEEKLFSEKLQSASEHTHLPIRNSMYHLHFQLILLSETEKGSQGLLLVVNDLTDIDRSTRAKTWKEVAKRIAHEIKNPLTPIRLSSERIKKQIQGDDEESLKIQKSIDTIIKQVDSIRRMVDDFFKFSQMPDVKLNYYNLNLIVEEVKQFFDLSLPANVSILSDLEKDLPKTLLDYDGTKQVLNNLIANALTSLGKGDGVIHIRTFSDPEEKSVVLNISDNGPGISPEIIEHIFEPYVTTKKEGVGLGLAIVDKIISDLKSTIRVSSVPNQETLFTIRFSANGVSS